MISGDRFTGIAPKYATHLLPTNAARVAKNCLMTSGELRPLKDCTFEWTPTKSGTIKSIWRYQPASQVYWFHWLEDVDVVKSPVANDAYGRVYWTGEAEPRMTTADIATSGGGTNYPTNYYKLGIPAPASAPTITHGSPGNANNIQSRAYIYTYVSAYGEEGPPTLASDLHDISDGDSVTVGLPSTGPSGAYNITSKNLYRLNSGVYEFVAQIAVATTTYSDTKLNTALGSGVKSAEYDPPPEGLIGLTIMPNGSLVGFVGNTVCLSEPYLPHAWPVRNQSSFPSKVVSIGAFGNSILVTTDNDKPYILSGGDPSSMFKEHFEVGQACLSKRGTVDMGDYVIAPTPSGLMAAGVGTNGLLTKELIDPRDFVSYAQPSTFLGAKHGDNYIYFNTVNSISAGTIFNAKTGDLSTMDIYATAAYYDAANGDLYIVVNGDIVKFDSGAALEMTWESKDFILTEETNFARARVRASEYPVTFNLYSSGSLIWTQTVSSKEQFSLPGGFLSDEYRYQVSGYHNIKSVGIANSSHEI